MQTYNKKNFDYSSYDHANLFVDTFGVEKKLQSEPLPQIKEDVLIENHQKWKTKLTEIFDQETIDIIDSLLPHFNLNPYRNAFTLYRIDNQRPIRKSGKNVCTGFYSIL